MKTKQIIFQRAISLMFACTALLVFNCSTSDDGDDGDDQPQNISFKVDITKIRATDIKDSEDTALEVYGIVMSRLNVGTTTDERALWSVDADNYLSVNYNDMQLSGSVTFTISEDNLSNSTITVDANLMELDFGNPHDNIGQEEATVSLNSITSAEEFQLSFTESSGQNLSLSYRITRL